MVGAIVVFTLGGANVLTHQNAPELGPFVNASVDAVLGGSGVVTVITGNLSNPIGNPLN